MNQRLHCMRTYKRRAIAFVLAFSHSVALGAQEHVGSAVDDLLEFMSDDSSLELEKVTQLPGHLHGELIAIAEFDDQQQTWSPMDGPQDFGQVAADRMTILGYEFGHDGFVKARYIELTDRRVESYTGVTADRRMSVNLYDDESDAEHLVLQLRIGARKLRYLLQRPVPESVSIP